MQELFKKTQEKTGIVVNVTPPHPTVNVTVNVDFSFPLPNPLPKDPFHILLTLPIFGTFKTIIDPKAVQQRIKMTRKRRKKNKKNRKKSKQKSVDSESSHMIGIRTPGNVQEESQILIKQHVEEFQNEMLMGHFLTYFKIVEKESTETLESLLLKDPTSVTVDKLKELNKSYQEFICKLDTLVAQHNLDLYDNENDNFDEILECLNTIMGIFDQLPSIQDILKQNINKKFEFVICSFLGLNEDVAQFMIG